MRYRLLSERTSPRRRCDNLFELLLLSTGTPPALSPTDGRGRSKEARRQARRTMRSVTFSAAGRPTLLATALNLEDSDWMPLCLRWLAAAGLRKLLLLHSDDYTCEAQSRLGVSQVQVACLRPQQLGMGVGEGWARDESPDWGLAAHPVETAYLQRGKMRLMELAVRDGLDVIFLDVDVLVLSADFVPRLAAHDSDVAFASDRRTIRNPDFLVHPEWCPASLPPYRTYVADWLDTGLLYARAGSEAALWLLQEVQSLMDSFVITDADGFQAVLSGHAQLADPLRSPRAAGTMLANQTWLKPLWLQTTDRLSQRKKRRGLSGQPGIKPLNAPLALARWEHYSKQAVARGLKWHVYPQEEFGNGPVMVESWGDIFARGFGSTRFDGSRSGSLLSVHVNCATKAFLMNSVGSFLYRPEPIEDTLTMASHDFPES